LKNGREAEEPRRVGLLHHRVALVMAKILIGIFSPSWCSATPESFLPSVSKFYLLAMSKGRLAQKIVRLN